MLLVITEKLCIGQVVSDRYSFPQDEVLQNNSDLSVLYFLTIASLSSSYFLKKSSL